MTPVIIGLVISTIILLPVFIYTAFRLIDFLFDPDPRRWGNYSYTIMREHSYVTAGSVHLNVDPENLDAVAAGILDDWFASDTGQRELLYSSHRNDYHCLVHLQGSDRTGEARG